MTLIEAIRTGKPFRRLGEKIWFNPLNPYLEFTKYDILADDWEIESKCNHCGQYLPGTSDRDPKVEITVTKFWEACGKLNIKDWILASELAKELGLE